MGIIIIVPTWLRYEPVGRCYCDHIVLVVEGLETTARDYHSRQEYTRTDTNCSSSEEDDEELNLMKLDPGQWKVIVLCIKVVKV